MMPPVLTLTEYNGMLKAMGDADLPPCSSCKEHFDECAATGKECSKFATWSKYGSK